jgi:hypothetical protein
MGLVCSWICCTNYFYNGISDQQRAAIRSVVSTSNVLSLKAVGYTAHRERYNKPNVLSALETFGPCIVVRSSVVFVVGAAQNPNP